MERAQEAIPSTRVPRTTCTRWWSCDADGQSHHTCVDGCSRGREREHAVFNTPTVTSTERRADDVKKLKRAPARSGCTLVAAQRCAETEEARTHPDNTPTERKCRDARNSQILLYLRKKVTYERSSEKEAPRVEKERAPPPARARRAVRAFGEANLFTPRFTTVTLTVTRHTRSHTPHSDSPSCRPVEAGGEITS